MELTIVIGRAVRDAELKTSKNGKSYCSADVALISSTGQEKFYKCILYDKAAEVWAEYVKKATIVSVEGFVRADPYLSKKGEPRASLILQVKRFDMIAKPNGKYKKDEGDNDTPVHAQVPITNNDYQDEGFIAVDPEEELPF